MPARRSTAPRKRPETGGQVEESITEEGGLEEGRGGERSRFSTVQFCSLYAQSPRADFGGIVWMPWRRGGGEGEGGGGAEGVTR